MNIEQLSEVLSKIEATVLEPVTPWQLKNIINNNFKTNLPGQMMYNYVSKGFIEAERDVDGKWKVQPSEVLRFAKKYATRNLLDI